MSDDSRKVRKELTFKKECELFEKLRRSKYTQFKVEPLEIEMKSSSELKKGIKYLSLAKLTTVQNQQYTTVIKRYVNNPEKFKNASINAYFLAK